MDAASSSTPATKEAENSNETRCEPAANESEEKSSTATGGESGLSTAAKGEVEMEVEGEKITTEESGRRAEGGDKEKGREGEGDKEKKEPEPDFEMLSNPARVLPQQVSSFYILPTNFTKSVYTPL